MNNRRFRPAPWLTALLSATTLVVHAQSTPTTTPATTPASTPERVEIRGQALGPGLQLPQETGSRLGLSSQQTPFSVEQADQAELQQRGVLSLADSARGFTGLSSALRPGAPGVFSSRGFAENALGVLFDGIRVGGATLTMRNADAFNFERVELLRGAASVLHGEGAGAGALNFVRRKPQAGPVRIDSLLQLGSDGLRRAGAAVTGTVAPGWDALLSGVVQHSDGAADNSRNKLSQLVGGVKLALPQQASAFAEVDLLDNRVDNAYWGTPLLGGQAAPQLARRNYNQAPDNRYDDRVLWLRAGLKSPFAGGQYQGQVYRYEADRDWKNFYAFSSTNVPGRIQARAVENLAYDHRMLGTRHELAWQSASQRALLGLEVQDTDFNSPRSSSTTRPDFDPLAPAPVAFDPLSLPRADARRAEVRTVALFAEHRWAITPALALLSGLRSNDLDARIARPVSNVSFDKNFRYTDARLGLSWDLSPQQTVYVSAATGKEPIESLFIYDPVQTTFDLTRYQALELGLKGQWRGERSRWAEWTVAVYDLSRRNLPAADPVMPGAFVQVGKQSSQGVELSLRAEVLPGWRVEANGTVLRARFDTPVNFVGGVGAVPAGNTPPNVPKRLANLSSQWQLAPEWRLGAQAQWVGQRQATVSNTLQLDAYRTLDAWVQWQATAAHALSLRVKNATDALPAVWASSGFGQTNLIYGEARRVDLSWSARW